MYWLSGVLPTDIVVCVDWVVFTVWYHNVDWVVLGYDIVVCVECVFTVWNCCLYFMVIYWYFCWLCFFLIYCDDLLSCFWKSYHNEGFVLIVEGWKLFIRFNDFGCVFCASLFENIEVKFVFFKLWCYVYKFCLFINSDGVMFLIGF